ncbi:helix-turn-helix transcriptional regulator [Sinorhizobium sp. BG8]|uniref:AraC family transcriptional regulator n=1 Tax=Sinorhizobium sp. BG8 TaxID=2613773 RepID=UPI00193D8B70|nr:helix-turn-helix transcriptional regulator [Sinorhizobium sp. BG8]QRM53920.1 AraC family transcriptional regulator [Sinorhizobium sp. BG8]
MRVDPIAGFEDGSQRIVGYKATFETAASPPPHSHRRGQIAYCPDAPLRVTAGGSTFVLGRDQAAWIPGDLLHRLSATTRRTALNLYIEPAYASSLGNRPRVLGLGPLERELIRTAAEAGVPDLADAAHGRLVEVLFDRLRPTQRLHGTLAIPSDRALARLQEEWLAGSGRDIDLSECAARLAVSPRTLQRRVLAATGLTFRRWRQKVVLFAAVEPLLRGCPVKVLAADCGYASASAFVAAFRAVFGITPGELQRQQVAE